MQLEIEARLYDIRRAAELIEGFVGGRSFDDLAGSALLRSAVERQLQIIGEAVGRIAALDPDVASRLVTIRG